LSREWVQPVFHTTKCLRAQTSAVARAFQHVAAAVALRKCRKLRRDACLPISSQPCPTHAASSKRRYFRRQHDVASTSRLRGTTGRDLCPRFSIIRLLPVSFYERKSLARLQVLNVFGVGFSNVFFAFGSQPSLPDIRRSPEQRCHARTESFVNALRVHRAVRPEIAKFFRQCTRKPGFENFS